MMISHQNTVVGDRCKFAIAPDRSASAGGRIEIFTRSVPATVATEHLGNRPDQRSFRPDILATNVVLGFGWQLHRLVFTVPSGLVIVGMLPIMLTFVGERR